VPASRPADLETVAFRLDVEETNMPSAARKPTPRLSLEALASKAAACRNCELWRDATQTVFGEGRPDAPMMLVGEQPGDQEDRAGRPFVGPAGRLLDEALAEAGIDRDAVYVTNAVKHFKWKTRGKRRIHQKPTWGEVAACRPWLDGELEAVRPDVLVLLGATAAQSLLGRTFRVTQSRGEPIENTGLARFTVATVHPSAVLRERDDDARRTARELLVADLRAAAALL
jgi:DNA polymerase